jgi:hypothetical protein
VRRVSSPSKWLPDLKFSSKTSRGVGQRLGGAARIKVGGDASALGDAELPARRCRLICPVLVPEKGGRGGGMGDRTQGAVVADGVAVAVSRSRSRSGGCGCLDYSAALLCSLSTSLVGGSVDR